MQGRLRGEALSCGITTECACCGATLHLRMDHELHHALDEPDANPMFFVPLVDFTRLRAKSIIDDF